MKKKLVIEFIEIPRDRVIGYGAFHSMDGGQSLRPVLHGETATQRPSDFNCQRSFWRIESIESCEDA